MKATKRAVSKHEVTQQKVKLEGSADGMDEGEPKVGGALRKLVGWLEGSEEGCVETRDDTADGELEEAR